MIALIQRVSAAEVQVGSERVVATLHADQCEHTAAAPEEAQRLFADLLARAQAAYAPVSAGVFGAHMQVSLVNEGPVTFLLTTR